MTQNINGENTKNYLNTSSEEQLYRLLRVKDYKIPKSINFKTLLDCYLVKKCSDVIENIHKRIRNGLQINLYKKRNFLYMMPRN